MSSEYFKNIKVYVQVNTSRCPSMEYVKLLNDKKTLCVRMSQDFRERKPIKDLPHYWIFQTNGVFFNDAPEEIYKTVTQNLLASILDGTNVSFIGFGQTGSGKSTTLHGLNSIYKNRGFSVRILQELMEYKTALRGTNQIDIEATCVEVHKNFVIDLLSDGKKVFSPFKNVTKLPVNSIEDAFTYLFFSEIKRSCYLTSSYVSHSRPSIFTIHVKNYSTVGSNSMDKFSKINIVDLSGADTVGNVTCLYKTKREIGESNLCKTQLEQLLLYLNRFRVRTDSKLRGWGCMVEYLSDSLKPCNILRFVGHIFTSKDSLHLTLSHLRFLQLAWTMCSAKVAVCAKPCSQMESHNLQKLLQYYVQQENLRSMLLNEDAPIHLTAERSDQLKNAVQDFIKSNIDTISLLNVSDVQAVLQIFRSMYQEREEELQQLILKTKSTSLTSQSEIVSSSSLEITQGTPLRKSLQSRRSTRELVMEQTPSETLKGKSKSRCRHLQVHSQTSKKRKKSLAVHMGEKSSPIFQTSGPTSKKADNSVERMSPMKRKRRKSRSNSPKSKASVEDGEAFLNYLNISAEDYGGIWDNFTEEESYKNKYDQLKAAAKDYLKISNSYHAIFGNANHLAHVIEKKKDSILKLQLFRHGNKFDMLLDEEEAKLDDIESNLQQQLKVAKGKLTEIQEELLAKQAEIKISLDDYHRLKDDIGQSFITYCRSKYNIYLGDGKEHLEDDKLLAEDALKQEEALDGSEEKRTEALFYTYQHEMNKVISKTIKVVK